MEYVHNLFPVVLKSVYYVPKHLAATHQSGALHQATQIKPVANARVEANQEAVILFLINLEF